MNLYFKKLSLAGILILTATMSLTVKLAAQQPQPKRPNILVIMGDDVGWFNIGAYHRGMMSGKTPSAYPVESARPYKLGSGPYMRSLAPLMR